MKQFFSDLAIPDDSKLYIKQETSLDTKLSPIKSDFVRNKHIMDEISRIEEDINSTSFMNSFFIDRIQDTLKSSLSRNPLSEIDSNKKNVIEVYRPKKLKTEIQAVQEINIIENKDDFIEKENLDIKPSNLCEFQQSFFDEDINSELMDLDNNVILKSSPVDCCDEDTSDSLINFSNDKENICDDPNYKKDEMVTNEINKSRPKILQELNLNTNNLKDSFFSKIFTGQNKEINLSSQGIKIRKYNPKENKNTIRNIQKITTKNTFAAAGYSTVKIIRTNKSVFPVVSYLKNHRKRLQFTDYNEEKMKKPENYENLIMNKLTKIPKSKYKGKKQEVFVNRVIRLFDYDIDKDFEFKSVDK